MRRTIRGFTLVELMMTLVVVVVLLLVAVPSFRSMITGQKIKTAASSLQSALLTARSEAIKRNANVTLAPSLAGQWNTGWTISASSTTLSTNGPVARVTITGPASVIFQSAGRLTSNSSSAVFKLSSSDSSDIRCVNIDLTGIPSVTSTGC